jgi:hypothetical protein
MAKTKPALDQTVRSLAGHNFDASKYIVLSSGVQRDAATGQLVRREANRKIAGEKPNKS